MPSRQRHLSKKRVHAISQVFSFGNVDMIAYSVMVMGAVDMWDKMLHFTCLLCIWDVEQTKTLFWCKEYRVCFGNSAKYWNEKDASTFDLTVWPLRGAVNTGLLLNSDGGAMVKSSQHLEKNTLFRCHFMPLNWPIFRIFPSLPASPLPGLYCKENQQL
jgi:hypothetical protein